MVRIQMVFVNKFCSHLKYYNITHDVPDLVFKKCLTFQYEPSKRLPVQIQKLKLSLKHVHSLQ